MFLNMWIRFVATRTQEAFETYHTVFEQWYQVFLVARNKSAPKPNVNVEFSFRSIHFRLQIFYGCGRRNSIPVTE